MPRHPRIMLARATFATFLVFMVPTQAQHSAPATNDESTSSDLNLQTIWKNFFSTESSKPSLSPEAQIDNFKKRFDQLRNRVLEGLTKKERLNLENIASDPTSVPIELQEKLRGKVVQLMFSAKFSDDERDLLGSVLTSWAESRGERKLDRWDDAMGRAEMIAVLKVIWHRVQEARRRWEIAHNPQHKDSKKWFKYQGRPKPSVMDVVLQKAQFSCWNPGDPNWAKALLMKDLAGGALLGKASLASEARALWALEDFRIMLQKPKEHFLGGLQNADALIFRVPPSDIYEQIHPQVKLPPPPEKGALIKPEGHRFYRIEPETFNFQYLQVRRNQK